MNLQFMAVFLSYVTQKNISVQLNRLCILWNDNKTLKCDESLIKHWDILGYF